MPGRTKHQPPGELKAGTRPNVMMMVCTAGHVDHGKTQLVRLLTGCETDRLKTEKERGLTIELGFAPCVLEGDLCVGIVDVPGHEKFVKNMVAGVSGIDMTILVVAADDGIMPQTIEHFQIMELLGVSHGIVALTKIDLVSEERINEVSEEIRDFLEGTFMEDAPICPVSSQTYDGFPEFYDVLVGQAKSLSRRRKFGIFRMPVSHVFKQKGFGVVIMGIPVDGTIQVGAEVEVVPGNQKGKIVGIQQFMNETTDGEFGQCLALNIPTLVKKPPVRGQVQSPGIPGTFFIFSCPVEDYSRSSESDSKRRTDQVPLGNYRTNRKDLSPGRQISSGRRRRFGDCCFGSSCRGGCRRQVHHQAPHSGHNHSRRRDSRGFP